MHQIVVDGTDRTYPKTVQLKDSYGNTFYYGNAGDYWHPPFSIGQDSDYRTHVTRIRDMEIRHDDVIISGFPKSGMHWHHELVSMLMAKSSKYHEYIAFMNSFLDFVPMSFIDQLPSPRLLITHVPFRYFPRQALEKKVKIVRLERNPKDVVPSFFAHLHRYKEPLGYPGNFEHFFRLFMDAGYYYGDLFDHLLGWQNGMEAHPDVDICKSVYEDIKQDTVQGVLKLDEYLGTDCGREMCQEIAEACGIEKMRPQKQSSQPEHFKSMFEGGTTSIYRKGQIGDWKNWFTVAMNEEFDQEYKKRMSGYKTQYRYVLE